ncbi:MAG: ABC transporter permease [Nitrospiria bacterium]
MKAIDRKLWRDVWEIKGQALAISLVIASGVATFIMSRSTLDSLQQTRTVFYRDYRFAEVFASLKRAPESLVRRIQEIPGVDRAVSGVLADIKIDIEGFDDPVRGFLISVPEEPSEGMNRLYLRSGRMAVSDATREVVVSEAFAEAHRLKPGDRLRVIVNGRRKRLNIVGIALSPEYIYQIAPGSVFPDFKRFGVLWMPREALSTAYDMKGAFNRLALTLSAHGNLKAVTNRLDTLLEPYGGLGAYGRDDQLSHRYLNEEFRNLGRMAKIFPVIFLGVAAFLLNVVVSRLVGTQREQIAILKAFGYRHVDIGWHYVKLVIVIVLIGVAMGVAGGLWLGRALSDLYMVFYRFPFLTYVLKPRVIVTASFVSVAAALLGTLFAVRRAVLLPPAEAMRPEPPTVYRETVFERAGFKRWLSQPSRMIARHIERRPLKSLFSVLGIAMACAIMMVGSFQEDAIDFMIDVQFGRSEREDLAVSFVEGTSVRAIHELQHLPGVRVAESFRAAPVRLRHGHRRYRTAIQAFESGGDLHRLLNADLQVVHLPASGIVLTDHLAKILHVSPGDRLTVEALSGRRTVREMPVAGLVRQYIGVSGYMDLQALNRFMGEGRTVSGAYLAVDADFRSDVYRRLKTMPQIAGTMVRESAIKNFKATMGETLLIFTFINTLLASTIAFGVVYNSARIMLSERSRELASLRVLGLTRGEISYIMLGELAVLTLSAIPLGFFIGRQFCAYIADNLQTDLFRVPLVLETSTYGFAASVVLFSAVVSGLIVRRHLDRLDLVAVLKTKE